MRLDKFLKVSRLIKRRTVANEACDAGRVTVNGQVAKASVKVVDNGAGIENENLEKVLDKFFQEDYNEAGSGLGLAISNEIVKLHGGKMILNSKKGVGTSITVKIKNTLIKSI